MIVVGYTPDKYGRAALEHGIAEAKAHGTEVTVDQLQSTLESSGVPFTVEQDVTTDPVEALLTAMEKPDADILVIGIRHRTPVGKLLMGSTAQRILLSCPKPVLAVKSDE
jgi:nucleotide-binding universal stress UspA family protein